MAVSFDEIRTALREAGLHGEARYLKDNWEPLVRLKVILHDRLNADATSPLRTRSLPIPPNNPPFVREKVQLAFDKTVRMLSELGVPPDTDWTSASLDKARLVVKVQKVVDGVLDGVKENKEQR